MKKRVLIVVLWLIVLNVLAYLGVRIWATNPAYDPWGLL